MRMDGAFFKGFFSAVGYFLFLYLIVKFAPDAKAAQRGRGIDVLNPGEGVAERQSDICEEGQMNKMIIESRIVLEIGQQINLPRFQRGPTDFTRAVVVREATEQEYVDSCLADPSLPEPNKELMFITGATYMRWYEVSAD